MSKTFIRAPKPPPPADNIISAFERGGSGQDTRAHISTKAENREPTNVGTLQTTIPQNHISAEVGRRDPSDEETRGTTDEGSGETTNVVTHISTKPVKGETTKV